MAVQPFVAMGLIAFAGLGATTAMAQSLATPAEFPPRSYSAAQFVDSEGCAFVRAGQGDFVTWVPRVTRNREQLCGFVPTFGSAPPEPAAPIAVVSSASSAPIVALAEPVDPAPSTVQRSIGEVCAGKSGVLPGYVTSGGRPVDCGPAGTEVKAAPEVAPVAVSAPVVTAAAPVVVPVPAEVPVVIADVPAPEPALRRVTRAEICAEIAATGKIVMDAATDAPVACPMIVAVNGQPAAPTAPMVAAAPTAPGLQAPAVTVAPTPARQSAATPRRATGPFSIFQKTPVPASNPDPATVAGESLAPPPGYRAVWTDGRINPQRGLRRITAEEAAAMGLAVQ